jgi:hypothetical protein
MNSAMTSARQGDLFGHETPDPSSEDFETPEYFADLDKVREELQRILTEARDADSLPWDARKTRLYQTIFPQMSRALPDDEGKQLRFAFETELERLQAA